MILSLYSKIDLKAFICKCVSASFLKTMHAITDTCLDSFRLNHIYSIELKLVCLLQQQLLFSLNVCVLMLSENTVNGQKDVDTLF